IVARHVVAERLNLACPAFEPERFQNPAQMRCGAAVAIEINLYALRHAAFHLFKFAFQASRALAQGELRLAQHVAATCVLDVADKEIMESTRPSRVWIPDHELLPATRDSRARALALRACSLALTSAKMIFSHAHGRTCSGIC